MFSGQCNIALYCSSFFLHLPLVLPASFFLSSFLLPLLLPSPLFLHSLQKKRSYDYNYNASVGPVQLQAIGDDCEGAIGDYAYSLRALSEATGGVDVSCVDEQMHTYWYRPCQVTQQPECLKLGGLITDPGVCQRDTRYAEYFIQIP